MSEQKKDERSMRLPGHLIALLAMVCLLSACGPNIVKAPINFPIQNVAENKKIPLTADLYLSPKFRTFQFMAVSGTAPVLMQIGDAMSTGAERAMRETFSSVTIAKSEDVKSSSQMTAVLITPEISDATLQLTGKFATWTCRVVCRWTVLSPDGKPLYMNSFHNEITHSTFATALTFKQEIATCMEKAIQAHYEELIQDLTARHWWDRP